MPPLARLRRRLSRDVYEPVLPERRYGWWAWHVIGEEQKERARNAMIRDQGHGYDPYGLSRDGVAAAFAITNFLYDRWFRVTSHHIDRLPPSGPVIVAANHSGMLPLDAMMLAADIARHAPGNRIARPVMDFFVPGLPMINQVFIRGGGVSGTRANFHELLDAGELLLVFPEGAPGISKPFSKRYQLQRWREGHAELAIKHGATIVPAAVIGAEEQWPQIAKLPIQLFGSPFLPVPATPIPMPVHYHLWYGDPIDVAADYTPDQALSAAAVDALAARVADAVEGLLATGLRERKGVFR